MMIAFWNRQELYTTSSMKEQAQIRHILSGKKIRYRIDIIRRGGRGIGENPDFANTYRFFVNRKDYERAEKALKENFRT